MSFNTEACIDTPSAIATRIPNIDGSLKSLPQYQQELKQDLPEALFKRTPGRVLYLVSFLALNIALITVVVAVNPAWYWKLLCAFAIGQFNASMGFLAHETLHGSHVKNQRLQDLIAAVGFAPFIISPTYWRFWHNRLHHGNTQLIYKDPDAFPTLAVYKRSRFMRAVFELSPGSKGPLSYFYFFYWFSFQSLLNQFFMRFRNKMWNQMDHARVTMEFLPIFCLMTGYVYWVGTANFLWLVLIPLLVQNYTVLSYISTNHNISPLTKVNDPLVNSLTVTTNRFWDFLHLNFGYHVEHHIFPRVSGRHAKTIHEALKRRYPETFNYMPKWRALKHLYSTPRTYKNSTELIHPKSLKTYPTIQTTVLEPPRVTLQ